MAYDIEVKDNVKKDPEEDYLVKEKKFWEEATGADRQEWEKRSDIATDYYLSKQWLADDLKVLADAKVPALTYNFIKPIIRNISGYQRNNYQATTIKARRGGTALLANVFSEIIRYIEDNSDTRWEKATVFLLGLIKGMGWIGLDIDMNEDPIDGELIIRNENSKLIFPDPLSRNYDLNKDGRFVYRCAYKDPDELEGMFPDVDMSDLVEASKEQYKVASSVADTSEVNLYDSKQYAAGRHLYRECWWKSHKRVKILINKNNYTFEETDNNTYKKVKLMAERGSLTMYAVREYTKKILNLTSKVGEKELLHKVNPLNGVSRFPLIQFIPDFLEGHAKGEVEDLQDPQSEINKRYSQLLHDLNAGVGTGWDLDVNAINKNGTSSTEDFDTNGAKTGFNMLYDAKKGEKPTRRIRTPLSEGHLRLGALNTEVMKRIAGTNPDLLGEVSDKGNDLSGKAMRTRVNQGLITTQIIHDNFRHTEQILGETLLEIIQKTDVINEEEVMKIVEEKNLELMPADKVIAALKDRSLGKYSVEVDTSPTAATLREDNFQMLLSAAKEGFPIPPQVLLKHSTLSEADKQEIIKHIAQVQAAQQAAPTDKKPPAKTPAQPAQ